MTIAWENQTVDIETDHTETTVLDVAESNHIKTEHPVKNRIERDYTIRGMAMRLSSIFQRGWLERWGCVISLVLGEHTSKGSLLLMTRREEGENILAWDWLSKATETNSKAFASTGRRLEKIRRGSVGAVLKARVARSATERWKERSFLITLFLRRAEIQMLQPYQRTGSTTVS
jgi:hypothetical protein